MKSKVLYVLVAVMVTTLLISGCSKPDASKQIVLDNPNEYDSLYVGETGIDRDESQGKHIKDKKMISAFIKELDGQELVQPTEEKLDKKRKGRTAPGNYQVGLFKMPNHERTETEATFITFYADGTIHVEQLGNDYFVKNTQPTLLNQLKTDWGITF